MAYAGAEFWDQFWQQRRESGQTVHFFSGVYLRELYGGWRELQLSSVPIPHRDTGAPYKQMWRAVAQR